jgi:hypothetical protein
MKIALWEVTQFSLVDMYQRFKGTCCIHYPGNNNVLSWYLHGAAAENRKLKLDMRSLFKRNYTGPPNHDPRLLLS